MELEALLRFVDLLNTFRKVERKIRAPGEERWETDSEHSFNMAMLAWYLVESGGLDLDKTLVIKYALAHDLVEAYAGDTYIYDKNEPLHSSKHEREAAAARRMKEEFPDFPELHDLIDRYERREDRESRFIYALDKIEPVLHIFEDRGRTWKEMGVTLEMVFEQKKNKAQISPEMGPYFDQLFQKLQEEESELF